MERCANSAAAVIEMLGLMFVAFVMCMVFVESGGVNDSNATRVQVFSNQTQRLFIGGSQVAEIEEAPFVVALVSEISVDQHEPFCSGSIILERWVLSAAHCGLLLGIPVFFQVYAGCSSDKEFDPYSYSVSRQIRDPVRVLRHPNWLPSEFHRLDFSQVESYFDVCLIEVESFTFNKYVSSIKLWAEEWEGVKQVDETLSPEDFFVATCTAYGWGKITTDQQTKNLRTANFTVRHGTGGCPLPYSYTDEMNRLSIFTPQLTGKSVCPGDSGGPLVCGVRLAGVAEAMLEFNQASKTVHQAKPPDCGGTNIISVWVYVCPMLEWIHRIVPESPDIPPSCRSPQKVYMSRSALVLSLVLLIQS